MPLVDHSALDEAERSFMRYLRASNRSPKTQELYSEAIHQLGRFLAATGQALDPTLVTRRTIEDFIDNLFKRGCSPATAATRYRGLHAFFKWLVDEEEIPESPMEKTRAPKIPETPPAVLTETQIRAMLATCATGTDFRSRRDHALLMLLVDTGSRLRTG
jgi:site-specific recombinase XerD